MKDCLLIHGMLKKKNTKELCPSPICLISLGFSFNIFQRKLSPQKAIPEQRIRIIMILIISIRRSLLIEFEKNMLIKPGALIIKMYSYLY